MSIVLDGTTGLAGAATGALNGTLGATTPSTVVATTITGTDLTTTGNTILGNASTDTLNVGNGGLIKDASGNVGVGVTPSAWYSLSKAVQISAGVALEGRSNINGYMSLTSNSYLNSAGLFKYIGSDYAVRYEHTAGQHVWQTAPSGTAGNTITFTDAMTLDASGNLSVGSTSSGGRITGNVVSGNDNAVAADVTSSSYTGNALRTGVFGTVAGTGFNHIISLNSSAVAVFKVLGNGNCQNTNNSYGAISDIKLKENIVDTSSKLDKLLQVKIRNYNLKTDPDHKQIGVIAQELETVFPSLIEETEDKETVTKTRVVDGVEEEYTEQALTGETTKAVKYSVFVPILIKAVQEQQALITNLTARLELLEAK